MPNKCLSTYHQFKFIGQLDSDIDSLCQNAYSFRWQGGERNSIERSQSEIRVQRSMKG